MAIMWFSGFCPTFSPTIYRWKLCFGTKFWQFFNIFTKVLFFCAKSNETSKKYSSLRLFCYLCQLLTRDVYPDFDPPRKILGTPRGKSRNQGWPPEENRGPPEENFKIAKSWCTPPGTTFCCLFSLLRAAGARKKCVLCFERLPRCFLRCHC